MVEVRKIHGRKDDERKRANWSKWMIGAVAAAAITVGSTTMTSCSNTEEGPIPIPPVATDGGTETSDGGAGGTDGGGCVPNPSPACFNNSFEVTLPAGSVTSVGELKVKMVGTSENDAGVEVAQFEILDSCGGHITTENIEEGQTKVYIITGTNLEITVTATEVSITNPAATLNVNVRCLTDGGVTDGGTGGMDSGTGGSDGGTGGMDGGSGGMDSGTGGMDSGTGGSDGGTGGMDSGTGGMDGGVTDGGTTDSGTGGSDGGAGGDAGMGGMDGGVTDGGTTDSGTGGSDGGSGGSDGGAGGMDGGVTDGGTTDGGPIDGSGVSCMGLSNGLWSGNIPQGSDHVVGGYTVKYEGPGGSGGALLDVGCGGTPTLDNHEFPEDIMTTIIDTTNGKQVRITPHSVGVQVNITVQVLSYP